MKKLILSIILSLFVFSANADHSDDIGEYYFQQIPALCSTSEKIENYLKHYKFKPVSISLGRERMVEVLLREDLNTYIVSHGWTHPLLEKIEVVKTENISRLEQE